MPHPDAVPFIEAFDPPAYVQIVTAENSVVREVLCRTSAFITDYTSVAFTMAFLRRMVFYFQFDRDTFYGGSHNWREGYFDYDRDGFGPVATSELQLMTHLRQYFVDKERIDPEYLSRMTRAIPDRDSESCARTFKNILDIRRPLAGRG
jgi:CDP-glycerol glycerophosphotransferase (TagB/SpsB family)